MRRKREINIGYERSRIRRMKLLHFWKSHLTHDYTTYCCWLIHKHGKNDKAKLCHSEQWNSETLNFWNAFPWGSNCERCNNPNLVLRKLGHAEGKTSWACTEKGCMLRHAVKTTGTATFWSFLSPCFVWRSVELHSENIKWSLNAWLSIGWMSELCCISRWKN